MNRLPNRKTNENALERGVRWGLALALILTGLSKFPALDSDPHIVPGWVVALLAPLEVCGGSLMGMSVGVRITCIATMALCAVGGFLQLAACAACGCMGNWMLDPAGHLTLISAVGLAAAWLFDRRNPSHAY